MPEPRRILRGAYKDDVVVVLRVEGEQAICALTEDGETYEVEVPVADLGSTELTGDDLRYMESDVTLAAELSAPVAYRRTLWLAERLREGVDDRDLPRLDREYADVGAAVDEAVGPIVAAALASFRAALEAVPPKDRLAWWRAHQRTWTEQRRPFRDVMIEWFGREPESAEADAWLASIRALRERIGASRHAGFANDLDGTAPIATNPVLEAAIDAAPHDDATWLVYGDWLHQQGDPRGELVGLTELSMARFVDRHERYLLGGLARYPDVVTCTWRRGFLQRARVMTKRYQKEAGIQQAALVATLVALPSSRFLETLELGAVSVHEEGVAEAVIAALAAGGPRPTLRTLAVLTDSEEEMLSWTETGPLDRVWPVYPNLTTLDLTAGSLSLGALAVPALRRLRVETCGLTEANLHSIVEAPLPALEALELWFGRIDALGLALAVAEAHPHITDLGLVNTSFTDDLAAALADSPLLANRERLDLSRGTLTDAGAVAIARARAEGRAPRLRAVDVRECYLTADGVAALTAAGLTVTATDQRTLEDERYCAVWE